METKSRLSEVFKEIDLQDFEKLADDEINTLTRLFWIMGSKLELIARKRKCGGNERRKYPRIRIS